jgi:hypothetical protein
MIDKTKFDLIKSKYGHCASWAIWAEEGETPKSNIGEIDFFEDDEILKIINPEVILVGLNWSRGPVNKPLANFHDPRPMATDFKIRYALKGTLLWGAYMTDILKDFDQKSSGKVMDFLKNNKNFVDKNIIQFKEEIESLNAISPKIVAFGSASFSIMKKNLPKHFKIYKIPHYANYGSKEIYREQIINFIKNEFNK